LAAVCVAIPRPHAQRGASPIEGVAAAVVSVAWGEVAVAVVARVEVKATAGAS
jgi:hypothetical protein